MKYECEACKDTGIYQGLLTQEPCSVCGGQQKPATEVMATQVVHGDAIHLRCDKTTECDMEWGPCVMPAIGGGERTSGWRYTTHVTHIGYRLDEAETILAAIKSAKPVTIEVEFAEEGTSVSGDVVICSVDFCADCTANIIWRRGGGG